MKRTILAILAVLISCQAACAANFVEVPYISDVRIYLDMDSIVPEGDHVLSWLKLVPGTESIEGLRRAVHSDVSYVMQKTAFREGQEEYQILEFAYYDADDNLLGKEEFPFAEDSYEKLPPTGYINQVYDEVMARDK